MKGFMAGVFVTLALGGVVYAVTRDQSEPRFETAAPIEQTVNAIVGSDAVDVTCSQNTGRIWRCDVATDTDRGASYKVLVSPDSECFAGDISREFDFAADVYLEPDPKLPEHIDGWSDRSHSRARSSDR